MSDSLVREVAGKLFADLVPPKLVNEAEAGEFPAALWRAVNDAGFPDALVASAETPGSLAGVPDAAAILREAGRRAAPLPLAETMIARWLLAGAGMKAPEGPLSIAPVERAGSLLLHRAGKGWRLAGRAAGLPWGKESAGIVALVEGRVALLAPKAADLRAGKSLAGEPRDDLSVDAEVEVKPAAAGVDAALVYRLGALSRAVLMAGALEEVLALTVQYANDRVQFGRPIGKFQAIQQQLALLAENVAAAGVIASAAVETAAGTGDFPFAVAAAKARVGEAAGRVAEIAHQVHGAIGFTHEHMLHYSTRRLWSWRSEFGGDAYWQEEIGRQVARAGAAALWPLMTGNSASA